VENDPDGEEMERLQRLDEALHWINVTQLQVERFVEAFLSFAETGGQDPTIITADAHFLLNACAQAEKALRRTGVPVPAVQRTTIRSLRDVHEHWEQHKKSFESKRNAKMRAGERFSEAHPGQLPWTFKFDATGTYISVLRLEDLWAELTRLEQTLLEERSALPQRLSLPPRVTARIGLAFPRRASKVLAMAMVTQNIVLDFADP
jgi:hypothetical protein